MEHLMSVIYFLIMIAIIFAAYITAKWVSLKSEKIRRGKYIEQLDRVYTGRDRSMVIVRIGQKVFLLSDSAEGLSHISDLSEEDLIPLSIEQEPDSFNTILDKFIGKWGEMTTEFEKKPVITIKDIKEKMESSLDKIIKKREGNEKRDEDYK